MKWFYFYSIPLIFLITQCAKQTQPTGGIKDEIPPKLVRSNPADRQTNFNKNEIELVFDEMVQVNSVREQLIITPAIGKKFEAESRKNKVVLKLNADLKENTTYTLSFREAIQDITERNSVINLKLAFSTGDVIDSLSIQGIVYNLLERKPLKNYTVAAILHHDTINIFKHEAQWITLTNEKGEYSLDNLKAGAYIVYAFEDKNKNLIVDSKSESYGFIGDIVVLTTENLKKNLPVVRLDARDFKLISARPIATYFNIRTTKGIREFTLKDAKNETSIHADLEDASTIRVFNTLTNIDSIAVRLHALDSIDNKIDTTLYVKFDKRSASREKFSAKLEALEFLKNKSTLRGEIIFSKPVAHVQIDSFYIRLDSVNNLTFTKEDYKLTKRNTVLILEKLLPKDIDFTQPQAPLSRTTRERSTTKEEEKPEPKTIPYNNLIIPKGAILSIETDSAASIQSPIKIITPENSATLIVEVDTKQSVIIQLLNKSYKVIASIASTKTRFENVPPGDYFLRVILDKNSNGVWDNGNIYKREEPEPITFYKTEKGIQTINLKANWEVGPLLITEQNFVDNP